MYQNQIINVIIGFKHAVSCIVRSEALRGNSDTSMHEARSASRIDWSSCLRSHNARCIMLKSLIILGRVITVLDCIWYALFMFLTNFHEDDFLW